MYSALHPQNKIHGRFLKPALHQSTTSCAAAVDLLEEIFLRLDDAADLARASAACTCFRRVVSDGRFLRRFRSLHRRPVLGFLAKDLYEPALFYAAQAAQPSRRSAQAAAGFAKAADFNFAFLPDRSAWSVCDVRDGRVLLARCPRRRYKFEDLVVYDPLHRRHVQIPTIPGDLILAGNEDNDDAGNNEAITLFYSPFLAPAVDDDDDDDDESLLRFQVMCIALSKTEVVAFVFSSASRQWRRGASFRHNNPSYDDLTSPLLLWFHQHVHGCVCWVHNATNYMLVYDTREMKLWIADLPHKSIGMFKMAVEAGDGRLGLLLLSEEYTTLDLYSKAKDWHGIQEPEEWRHDSSISIIPAFHLTMLAGVTEGYALLRGIPQDQHKRWIRTYCKEKPEKAHYFTLDLKTLQVEKRCVLEFDVPQISFLYASFPPLFSPPCV